MFTIPTTDNTETEGHFFYSFLCVFRFCFALSHIFILHTVNIAHSIFNIPYINLFHFKSWHIEHNFYLFYIFPIVKFLFMFLDLQYLLFPLLFSLTAPVCYATKYQNSFLVCQKTDSFMLDFSDKNETCISHYCSSRQS